MPNWLISSGSREPFAALEQERGAARLHGAVDDLGDLEVGVDLGRDANELTLALEQANPLAQVGRGSHQRESNDERPHGTMGA